MKITLDKKKSARRGGIHVATATLFAKDFVFENYVIVCLASLRFFEADLYHFFCRTAISTPIAQ